MIKTCGNGTVIAKWLKVNFNIFLCSKQLSMASGKSTREYLTIRRNLSLIVENLAATVDPARLALKLLEVHLITDDVADRANVIRIPTRDRIQPIVMAIEAQIQLDVSTFQVLIGVLQTFNLRLAERLKKFYSKLRIRFLYN